jgi:tetratricopeptide (TPR) repeat protein
VGALQRSIDLDGGRAEAYYNLGLAYRRQGRLLDAVQSYRVAIRLDPRLAEAHFNLANVYVKTGQNNEAVHHYRTACEIRPAFENARRRLRELGDCG